jgi:hypothetical protein
MATEQPLAPSVSASATGDPEKTMHELEQAMSNSKLQNTSFVPDPVAEKTEVSGQADGAVPDTAANGTAVTNGTAEKKEPAFDITLPLSSKDGPVKTPLRAPLESSKPKVRPDLTTDQQEKYNKFLATVEGWTEIPNSLEASASKSPIEEHERMYLTRDCLLRYLRADKWNLSAAETRLRNTLAWRREFGVDKKLTPEYMSIENETGKQLIVGFDNEGRPCQIMRPSKQNTERGPRQIEHLVFMLERSIDLMPAGQETLTLQINFAETKAGQGATLAQGRQTLWILQNHYPERLGRALVTNVPWMIWGFFKLITPFIDPLTKEKIKFNEDSKLHVPPEQLLKECGGLVEFEYDHAQYWPALNKLAEQKRAERKARWEKAGKRVGEYENYLKGGQEESLADIEKKSAATAS